MRFIFRSFLIAAALLITGQSSAWAEVFYYKDPFTKVSLTVPDTWKRVSNQKPDDVYTFYAPGNDYASCRMRVREDRRYVIFPQRYDAAIQHLAYSREFWDEYLGEYTDTVLHSVTDNAGLGRGVGSFAEATYTTAVGPRVEKRSIMFVSLYHDNAYIIECSAHRAAFARWHRYFNSIIKSVDFRKIVYDKPNGNYRNFLADKPILINGPTARDATFY